MATQAQITANRLNAQNSTGPSTPAGKASSCLNNFRHGLTGDFNVLDWEDREDYERLLHGLKVDHQPKGVTEQTLVEKMAQALFLSKRAQNLQDLTFSQEMLACDREKQLALYIRYQTMHDRAFHRCLNDLLKLRAEKSKQEIGFDSQKRKEAEEIRKADAENRRQAAEKRKEELHKWAVLLAEAKLDHQQLQNLLLQRPVAESSHSAKAD